jgi:hypothetical protein
MRSSRPSEKPLFQNLKRDRALCPSTPSKRSLNHQGLGNALIDGNPKVAAGEGGISRRERLGGLLNFYHREAA